jgi:hypothetical protein
MRVVCYCGERRNNGLVCLTENKLESAFDAVCLEYCVNDLLRVLIFLPRSYFLPSSTTSIESSSCISFLSLSCDSCLVLICLLCEEEVVMTPVFECVICLHSPFHGCDIDRK